VTSGPFYDAFTNQRESWSCITIDAQDTPNLAGVPIAEIVRWPADDPRLDVVARPYLTTRRWVWQMWRDCGEDPLNPAWQARVRAQFPVNADDCLIPLSLLEAAKQRPPTLTEGSVRVGIDVAGPGEDETVVYVHQAGQIVGIRAWPTPDPRGEVAAFLATWKNCIEKINVDSAGIGYYFARHLKDLGYPVQEVNVGQSPRDKEQFANLKAELYWGLRKRFLDGDVAGLTDERTISQLAGIKYQHNSRGQVVIESKEDARKRGVKSPDRAEALMLAMSQVAVPGFVEFYRQRAEERREEASVA